MLTAHRRRGRPPFLLFAGCAVGLGCGGGGGEDPPPEVTFDVVDSAGVAIVRNHAGSWTAAEAWTVSPEPVIQLGGGTDAVDQFYQVRRVRMRSDGGVAVLEGGSATVRIFDTDGRPTAAVGGEGDGPGELRGPRELYVLPGDTLAVWDNRPSESRFGRDGTFITRWSGDVTPIRNQMLDRITVGYRGLPDGSLLAVGYAPPVEAVGRNRNRMLFTHASRDGGPIDTLGGALDREWWTPTSGRGRGRTLLGPESVWAVGARPPEIAIGESATASVRVSTLDGALDRIVHFPDGDRTVPAGVLEAAKDDRRDVPMPSANLERFLADAPPPEEVPAFGGLLYDPTGHLWVLPYLPDEGGSAWSRPSSARILDPEGRLLGSVELPAGLRVHDIGIDRLTGVRMGGFDVELVEVHALRRPTAVSVPRRP